MNARTLCLDARMIGFSGIGTYLQGLLAAIRSLGSFPGSLTLLGDPQKLPQGPWSIEPLSSPIYSLQEQLQVPLAVKRAGGSILHSPHYNMARGMASRTIVTVHDVIHLKFPDYWPSLPARAYAYYFFHHVVPQARAILTVSENTKRDLVELLSIPENRITVAYPGVSQEVFQVPSPTSAAAFHQLGLPAEYLLYVGNLKEFKNVQRLVDAYQRVCSRRGDCPPLVLVGKNFIPGFDQVIQNTPGIRWIGEADRALLPWLYKNALAFLFPSLYEGFGLPPLEAMASGTPVLCSNRASLPEVVGEAALLVDPENTEGLAAAIQRMIEDPALRKALSAKGLLRAATFSWERMARKTLAVYDQCMA